MSKYEALIVGPNGFLGKSLSRYMVQVNQMCLLSTRENPIQRHHLREVQTVYWLASSVTPNSAEKSPTLCTSDVSQFSNFVEMMRLESPATRIVLASSGGAVYADGNPPFAESDSVDSPHAYAKLKIDMENILIESGLSHVILRIANAYGPGQLTGRGQGVLAEWISSLKSGNKPQLFGSTEVERDFVHIDDVVRALWLAGQLKNFSGVINIGSGKPVSLRECLAILSDISDEEIEINTVPPRAVDRARVYLSIERAASVLNWVPSISLDEGLRTWWNEWEK